MRSYHQPRLSNSLLSRSKTGLLAFTATVSLSWATARPSFARNPEGDFAVPTHMHLADALRLFRQYGLDLILAEAAVCSAFGAEYRASR